MTTLTMPLKTPMAPELHLVAEITLREPSQKMSMIERLGLSRLIQKTAPADFDKRARSSAC